jgi:hypothetical protein
MGARGVAGDWTMTFSAEVTETEREEALALLDGLVVRPDGWEPATRYSRQLAVTMPSFPQIGLTMKDHILTRDLTDRRYALTDGFTVKSGLLRECPYSGAEVRYEAPEGDQRSAVHIDHIVSVSDAWDSGGHRWSPKGRNWQRFCNWPANLLAVSVAANTSKGDKNAAGWLPDNPKHDYRRRFAALQVAVKARYRLSVTESEAAAMRGILGGG